jgi:hypothetical protein
MMTSGDKRFSWLQTLVHIATTALAVGVLWGTHSARLAQLTVDMTESEMSIRAVQTDIGKMREIINIVEASRFTSKDALNLSDSINRLNVETTRLAVITAKTEQTISKLEEKVDRVVERIQK